MILRFIGASFWSNWLRLTRSYISLCSLLPSLAPKRLSNQHIAIKLSVWMKKKTYFSKKETHDSIWQWFYLIRQNVREKNVLNTTENIKEKSRERLNPVHMFCVAVNTIAHKFMTNNIVQEWMNDMKQKRISAPKEEQTRRTKAKYSLVFKANWE